MKRKFLPAIFYMALLFLGFGVTSCDDDDDDDLQTGASVITIENIIEKKDFVQSNTFGGIEPGNSLEFKFYAAKGQRLMLATMYGYSNDIFFAPENPGIQLYDNDGKALTGDVSSQIKLWDNGTRQNQAPGSSIERPGVAQTNTVTMINGRDEQGHTYPAASELMRVELAYNEAHSEFTITITNISTGKANETPFSPGVFAVSNVVDGNLVNANPFFTPGQRSSTQLTLLAEKGENTELGDMIIANTGVQTNLSPVLVVVYTGDTYPIFEAGAKDKGLGLKELAQTGNTEKLKESLERLRYVKNVYVAGSTPIAPGEKEELKYTAENGDKIAIASMFSSSNDWFFSAKEGINANEIADRTNKIGLFDNGTAVNQFPGAGNKQAMFDGTSDVESINIVEVDESYLPAIDKMIRITLR